MIVYCFFNDTAPTEIYTLSLHDALPILYHNCGGPRLAQYVRNVQRTLFADLSPAQVLDFTYGVQQFRGPALDRKSTRLNSSHVEISYAVFCLKKKKKKNKTPIIT